MGFLSSLFDSEPLGPAVSKPEMIVALKSLNRPTAPYVIREAQDDEPGELVAEWKIVDAQWYQIFAKANLTKVFKIFLALDDNKKQIKALDQEYSIAWEAGVPSLSLSMEKFQGQKLSWGSGKAYAFTEELKPGTVYNYRFSTKEIKDPIKKLAKEYGWKYKGVIRKKALTSQ